MLRGMYQLLISATLLLPTYSAQAVTINDGLTSTVRGLDLGRFEDLFVRNVGCSELLACPSPGAATRLTLVDSFADGFFVADSSTLIARGGGTNGQAQAFDSSTLIWDGAFIGQGALAAHDDATIILRSGVMDDDVLAYDRSFIRVEGGLLARDLWARQESKILVTGASELVTPHSMKASDNGLIEIVGSGFQVDGVGVGFGDMIATTGILSGVLASGESFDTLFFQGGSVASFETFTGTIRLSAIPEPSTALLIGIGLLGLAAARHDRRGS